VGIAEGAGQVGAAKRPARRPPSAAPERPASVSAPRIWAEPRNLFFFRTARLAGKEGEALCEILALAESGAVLRANAAHDEGEGCALELNSLHHLPGKVAWTEEDRLGLEFDDRDAVRKVLASRELSFPYRAPRLHLRLTLEIRLGARRLEVRSQDMNESGIKLELPVDCAGEEAILSLDGLGPVAGRVRWWRDGQAGISFARPIPSAAFTRWITPRLESCAG
jgi:hypothetical protein